MASAQPMAWAPGKRSFRSGMASRFSFGAEPKKRLSCKKPTPAYSSRKYAAKTISAGRTVPLIAIPLPSFPETARYSWIFSSMSRSGSSRGLLRAAAA